MVAGSACELILPLEGDRRLNSAIRLIPLNCNACPNERWGGPERNSWASSRSRSNGSRALAAATRCFLTAIISERKSISRSRALARPIREGVFTPSARPGSRSGSRLIRDSHQLVQLFQSAALIDALLREADTLA